MTKTILKAIAALMPVLFLLVGARSAVADTPADKSAAKVESFLGSWREIQYEAQFIIEQIEPRDSSRRNTLKLTTKKGEWVGEFEPGNEDRPTKMTFIRRPRWQEMNADIPDWVRKQIEEKLQWKLELETPEGEACVPYDLKGRWYPGEVKWSDGGDADSVSVSGPGEPIELKLLKADDEIELNGFAAPRLVVYTNSAAIGRLNPVKSLIKLQRFHIEYQTSREDAQRRGMTVQVQLKDNESGASDTVELETTSASMKQLVVRYTHQGDLTIADYGDEANRRSTLGPVPALRSGDRLAMSVENGDEITASVDDAKQSFKIYNSWVQRGIAARNEALDKLALFLSGLIAAPDSTVETRQQADQRLMLIRHARIMLNEPHQLRDFTIHDYIKYYIGEEYDQLLLQTDHQWYSVAHQKPPDSPFGFAWASPQEQNQIMQAIATRREEYKAQAAMDLTKAGTYALYSFVAGTTGAGDFFVLFRGADIFGNPVDRTDRLMAALSIGTNALTVGLMIHFNASSVTSPGRINRLGARAAIKESVLLSARAPADAPASPAAPAGTPTRIVAEAPSGPESDTGTCVESATAEAATSGARSDDLDARLMQQVYPKAEIIPAPKELRVFRQSGGECRYVAQDVARYRVTKEIITPDDGRFARQELEIDPEPKKEAPGAKPDTNAEEERPGAKTHQIQSWVNATGGEAYTISNPPTRVLLELHKENWAVSLTIYLDNAGWHQVALWDVEKGGLFDRPEKIVFMDSNFPTQLGRMRLCDFEAMRATPGMRAPKLVKKTLPSGVKVRTLEMRRLEHGTADIARYNRAQ